MILSHPLWGWPPPDESGQAPPFLVSSLLSGVLAEGAEYIKPSGQELSPCEGGPVEATSPAFRGRGEAGRQQDTVTGKVPHSVSWGTVLWHTLMCCRTLIYFL